jgi:hypothetical protein
MVSPTCDETSGDARDAFERLIRKPNEVPRAKSRSHREKGLDWDSRRDRTKLQESVRLFSMGPDIMNRAFSILSFRILGGLFCFLSLISIAMSSDPVGVWKGEWRSESTGHHGPMRANIQPRADGTYQARFTGRFAVVVPFVYGVTLQPAYDANGNQILMADKKLGPVLGGYRMQAQTMGGQLQGSFQAAGDTGSVRMRRIR